MEDKQYKDWLSSNNSFRCHLVEVDYIDQGEVKTLYLSNAPFQSSPTDTPANMPYNDVIINDIKLSQQMNEIFYGRTSTVRNNIEILSTPFISNPLLFDVAGQEVRIYLGDPVWPKSDFRLISRWFAEDIEPNGNNYTLPILDSTHALDKPLCDAYQVGIAQGKIIPRSFGVIFNAEAILIDDAGHGTYQVNSEAITGLTVYDSGREVAVTEDLPNGQFTLIYAAQGRITCDIEQEDKTCQDIVVKLLSEAGLNIQAGTFDNVPDYELGAYLKHKSTIRDLIDDVCVSVGYAWSIDNNNELKMIEYNGAAGDVVGLLTDDDIEHKTFKVKRRILSAPTVNLHYAKNFTPMQDGLSTSVTLTRREALAKEWSVISTNNAQVAANYPSNPEINAYTLLVKKEDAEAEAIRRAALNVNIKKVYSMRAYGSAIGLNVGEKLNSDFMQDLGGNCFVLAVEAIPSLGFADIEVMK